VRVSLKAVPGVDTVDVSLEKGLATVHLKPGNSATLKQLQNAITKNGFTMKESKATIAGTIVVANGELQLNVSGSNDVLQLSPESQNAPNASALQGKSVLVVGSIPEAPKGQSPNSLVYRSLTENPDR
jgi:copper chaperone CopZ